MRVLFLTIVLLIQGIGNAQKIDCSIQINEYQEFLSVRNFADAKLPWEFVAKNCPKQSVSVYTDGIQIYQYQILVLKFHLFFLLQHFHRDQSFVSCLVLSYFCLIVSDIHWHNIVILYLNDVSKLNPCFFFVFIANFNATRLLSVFKLSDTL